VHKYARIQSTTREQYAAAGGDPAVLHNFFLYITSYDALNTASICQTVLSFIYLFV
jgi:hypothetical protein